MTRFFIAVYQKQWAVPAKILCDNLDFQVLNLNCAPYSGFPNKLVIIKQELLYILAFLKKFKIVNHSDVIISPNYLALFLLLLKKLNILKVRKLCWFAMFVHSPKMIRIIGKIVKLLSSSDKGFKIIIFSKAEIHMYSQRWNLPEDLFIYCPYGDWNEKKYNQDEIKDDNFYFSGGYSNRDYVDLIKIFKKIPEKLIIIASKKNTDLIEYQENNKINENIQIFYDLPQQDFDRLLLHSKAVIFHMKDNTGASGQMVVLNAMCNRKLIISSQNDSINDYVQDGLSAIFYNKKNADNELSRIICSFSEENSEKWRHALTNAAYKEYESKFTYNHLQMELIKSISRLL